MGYLNSIGVVAEGGATPASGIQTALESGFTSIATDMTTTVTNELPVILGVVGLVLVVSFAIKFFRKNAK